MALFNARPKVLIVIGILWMAITLAIYLIATGETTSVQKLGLFFLLFAEALVVGFLILQESAEDTSSVYRIGSYSAAALYAAISILTGLVHAAGWALSSAWLLTIELLALGIFLTTEIALYFFSKGRPSADGVVEAKMSLASDIRGRLDNLLKLSTLTPELTERLNKIVENVSYFDKTVCVAADSSIGDKIGKLELLLAQTGGDVPEGVGTILEDLLALTKIREREAAEGKRGAF
jgi:hypothetical protein